jgi:hypothetical protein
MLAQGYCALDFSKESFKISAMDKRRYYFLSLIVLFIFVAVILSIEYFHTEKGALDSPFCPACHFIASALGSLSEAILFFLVFFIVGRVSIPISPLREMRIIFSLICRAPPQS